MKPVDMKSCDDETGVLAPEGGAAFDWSAIAEVRKG
jgi:hypothetical protein